MDEELPPFDPTNHCVKCGNEIPEEEPEPEKPEPGKPAAKPKTQSAAAPKRPLAAPPNVTYCDGFNCPWFDDPEMDEEEIPEHMHAVCTVCGYEWLTKTLDAE